MATYVKNSLLTFPHKKVIMINQNEVNMSILSFWPDSTKTPRPIQTEALLWMEKQSAKYIICELPVGTGKSMCGVVLSRYLDGGHGNSFILTPQRILQKQYEKDFEDNPLTNLVGFYGKSNYTCHEKNTNCNTGALIKPKCSNCSHTTAKGKAKTSSNLVLNYDLALLQFNHVRDFNKRELMVCDEGHSLEALLTEFDAMHISKTRLEQVNVKWAFLTNLKDAYQWTMDTYLPALQQRVNQLKREIEPLIEENNLIPDDIKRIQEYLELVEHFTKVSELQTIQFAELKEKYVLVHDKLNIKFKRLHAAELFSKYLAPMANRFLIMSATIPNHEEFCRDLGLPLEEVAFISLKTEFPKENRQVVHIPCMKMNYDWDKPHNHKARQSMIDSIKMACNLHQNEKGIIHTTSFNVSEWVVKELKIPQKIFHHNPDSGDDRNSVIKAFMDYPNPAVLISPSITEGLDLKYDLGRFGIIVKTPYPYLGDQWVKARMELSGEWYQRQTIIQVMQACGRIVRAADDTGITYILDGSWTYLYKLQAGNIPKWWREAYTQL